VNAGVFSPAASKDLLEIVDYIAERNPDAAERLRDRFLAAVEMLARRPGLGHSRHDFVARVLNVRFWPVGRYLIIYRSAVSGIQVVRVLSGYRNIAAVLGAQSE
jgi:plasmid stabilization system protein ParE